MKFGDPRRWSLAVALVLVGCAADDAARPARPAPLLHLVFISLTDPTPMAVDALRHDCDRLLAGIPSVRDYAAARPVDTGRPGVLDDYDLALFITFDDEEGYREYVEHPDHLALVAEWMPRLSNLVVRDAVQ